MDKERIIAITKSDMLDEELMKAMKKELPNDKNAAGKKIPCVFISSVSGTGIQELKDRLWDALINE
jgi:GTP-binding protein